MNAMTIGVDLAKNVFEVALQERSTVTRRRVTRQQFERLLHAQPAAHVVMEACGSAHHWARVAQRCGHRVSLLPPHRVRPYVDPHRKTDRTDAAALLEAVRNPAIHPVAPKTMAQQELLALHRVRHQWMKTRTARINTMRGLLQEVGIPMARGARTGCATARGLLADATTPVPAYLRTALQQLLLEIRELETRMQTIERQLTSLAATDPIATRLQDIPGIGLLTATALTASVGHIHAFRTARRFASWLGVTPREHSSGDRRRLGRISKAGDAYLRMLLTHGARAVLRAARLRQRRVRPLARLHRWACAVADRRGHNTATIALANKLARVVWVVWARDVKFVAEPTPAGA